MLEIIFGKVRKIGASQTVYGEEGRKNLYITKELFKQWEDFPEIVRCLDNLPRLRFFPTSAFPLPNSITPFPFHL